MLFQQLSRVGLPLNWIDVLAAGDTLAQPMAQRRFCPMITEAVMMQLMDSLNLRAIRTVVDPFAVQCGGVGTARLPGVHLLLNVVSGGLGQAGKDALHSAFYEEAAEILGGIDVIVTAPVPEALNLCVLAFV